MIPADGTWHGVTTTGAGSAAVAGLLTGSPRPLSVLAAFPAAAYLAHDGGVLALVSADGVHHPNAVVLTTTTAARPLSTFHGGEQGRVGGGALEVGALRVTVARWFDPVPRLRATPPALLAEKLDAARSHVLARTGADGHDLSAPTRQVVDALLAGDAERAVTAAHTLVGAGPGLTPAGDDVLAGLVAAVVTLGPAVAPSTATAVAAVGRAGDDIVAHARTATTAVSAELLRHAVRGEVAAPAAAVLHALTGRRPAVPALDELLLVGATSGRDLAYGLLTGAALVLSAADGRSHLATTSTGAL